MCVIVVCPQGTELAKNEFHKCFDGNDDGAGFAWIKGKRVHFNKGFMNESDAWKAYNKIRKYPHVAHFRLVSAGRECKELCHPFIISKDSPIRLNGTASAVLFHNGTVYGWQSLVMTMAIVDGAYPAGEMSDSRAMAMVYARVGEKIIENDTGKWVVANKDNFVTYGFFTENEGRKFSNMLWNTVATENGRLKVVASSYKQPSLYDDLWGGRNYYGY